MADFGLTEDMYATKYFCRGEKVGSEEKVPIKWMAPESIESSLYNERTDVVRYYESKSILFWHCRGPMNYT